MGIISIDSSEDFNKALADAGDKLVVVDFYATWCGPCKVIAPYLEQLSGEYGNVVFLKVDVDDAEDLAQTCNVSAMPTFQFYKNKSEIKDTVVMGASKEKLKAAIEANK